MKFLTDILSNHMIIAPIFSWLVAQVLKIIIHAIVEKKFSLERLFGDGGMPSGHSATVCSLAAYAAITYGTGSFAFALTAILALIVCHDATGVRRETGKQAVILNEMRKSINDQTLDAIKIKEFVGHTPLQVIVGGALGVITALLWSRIL